MEKKIMIFKSFEEQEMYDLAEMRKTTVMERFVRLYRMQQFSTRFHPITDHSKKIVILHARPE
ncbi:MAG TPA: hypothetical protein VI603_02105 [Saprospiraceae bacterium]|nr:hypothetical protein [Saprospiraceae bacterium]